VPTEQVIGSSLLDWVQREDRAELQGAGARTPEVVQPVRLRTSEGVSRVSLLVGPFAGGGHRVVACAEHGSNEDSEPARTEELERRLRRIGVEVQASGVLDLSSLAREQRVEAGAPQPELSARQLEILMSLIAGNDIREVAASLFLSPSTVRNHLSAIYRKFGVHSQAELFRQLAGTDAVIHRRPDGNDRPSVPQSPSRA
jgi:DNA-binding CsgD family transcriptional regulator